MTDKQFELTRGRVQSLLNEWALGENPRMVPLKQWIISVHYKREGFEAEMPGTEAAASVESYWMYMSASMEINCPWVLEAGDLELENTIVHELCHILVNEMREFGPRGQQDSRSVRTHEERVVTQMALAFLGTKYKDDKGRTEEEVGE